MALAYKRSEAYYNDTVIFLVEDTLFKVAKDYFVQHSIVFRDMFSIPQPEGEVIDGSSDEHPLLLEGVRARDFETFLQLAYPRGSYSNAASSRSARKGGKDEAEKSRKDAIDLYAPCAELCRRWCFHDIHAECISRINKARLGPADRVTLGKRLHMVDWIHEGYQKLVERPDKLSTSEGEQMGIFSTVGVCQLREDRLKGGLPKLELISAIEVMFKDELKLAKRMNEDFYANLE